MRDAVVRFYIDADILGVGKVIAALRSDVTYPGDPGATVHKRIRPACAISTPKALDDEWIPVVARNGWLALTRDFQIVQHRSQVQMVRETGARLVAISGKEAGNTWSQLEILMTQWRRIEALVELPGPFAYTVTRTSLAKVDLG